jgi:hypothetical protein
MPSIMKVALVAVWIVVSTWCHAEGTALPFPEASQDLQDGSSEVASLQETQAWIATCPVCRSAEEIQQTGLFRSLFGHVVIWWFNHRLDETRFVNVLKNTEIQVDPSKWAKTSQQ